jgi:hypothetical protein
MKAFLSIGLLCYIVQLYAQHPFAYLSPVPHSTFNHAGSTIIIHPGYTLTEPDVALLKSTTIIGSQSGLHTFHIVLAKQGQAAIFKFKDKFCPAETVNVTFNPLLKGSNGHPIGNYQLQYTISNLTDQDRIHLRNAPNIQLEIPIPPREEQTSSRTEDETYHQYQPAANGYLFLSNTIIRRMDGSIVKDLIPSGDCFRRINDTLIGHATYGGVYLYNTDYSDNHRYSFIKDTPEDTYAPEFHDFLITPSHNALLFGVDTVIMDLSAYPNGNTNTSVRAMVIEEIDKQTNEIVWLWKTIDYLKPWESALNNFGGDFIDYVHCNALSYDTDGNVILGSPIMHEVTKIQYPAGNILWRLGGKKNQFTFINDEGFQSHHHAVIAENGHLTMFDNGKARAVEYIIDPIQKTATKVWDMVNPAGAPSPFFGSHQILPNGNRLISWGYVQTTDAHPIVSEIAPDGTTVFGIIKTSGFGGYYRAYKYTWNATQVKHTKTESDPSAFVVSATISRPSNCEVTLSLSPNSTLNANDITIAPDTLLFQQSNSSTTQNFIVSVQNDDIAEHPEWGQLILTASTPACPLSPDTIQLTILDNDKATATTTPIITTTEETSNISDSITLNIPRNCTITASPDWANSTASPNDIEITNNFIEFTEQSTSLTQSFSFHILDDTLHEDQETLFLHLAQTGDCNLTSTSLQISIIDNDTTSLTATQDLFVLAPNPVENLTVITFKPPLPSTFSLYDAKGAELYNISTPTSPLHLNLVSLPKGTYSAVALYGNKRHAKNIIKR